MELEHIAIRRPEYVGGSSKKPELKIFVQTQTNRMPLPNVDKLKQGQIVWMQWVGGPIAAKAKIASWQDGLIEAGHVNDLRNLTVGTELFNRDEYWNDISKKGKCYFVVVKLRDGEWLEKLIYPTARSYGSAWKYLENEEEKKEWLSNTVPPEKDRTWLSNSVLSNLESKPTRNIPPGIRFLVLKRDNFTCIYCGRSAPNVILHIDHKVPWNIVKKHDLNNLVTACADCNLGKGKVTL